MINLQEALRERENLINAVRKAQGDKFELEHEITKYLFKEGKFQFLKVDWVRLERHNQ